MATSYKGRTIPDWIVQQYEKTKKRGWLPAFQREAQRIGETTAGLLGISSRETNIENIRGDFRNGHYNGFGAMQVDIGTDPEYARTWSPVNWERGIIRGADILKSKMDELGRLEGRTVTVKGHEFYGREMGLDDFRRIATSMYNNGRWPYYAYSKGRDIDSFTTGKNYGKDVYFRAIHFAALLEMDGIEPDALRLEAERQGDYCYSGYQQWAGVKLTPDEKINLAEAEPPRLPPMQEKNSDLEAEGPKPVQPVEVAIPAVRPVNAPQENSFWDKLERVKNLIVAAGTGAAGIGLAAFDKIFNMPVWALAAIFGGLALVAIAYMALRAWRNEQRERRAHELTVIQAQTAARTDQNTVRIVQSGQTYNT